MKTKFTSILKVRKLEVEKLENEIAKLQNQKRLVSEQIRKLHEELKDAKIPQNGSIISLKQSFYMISIIKENIELKKQNILFLNEQIKSNQELLKKAMLEYEKIKHLHEIEEKKILEKIKKLEEKNMDEIASQLFSRRIYS